MASSSLSQESLDHEDAIVDISARRSRVRGGRVRGTAGSQQRFELTDESRDVEVADDRSHRSAGWLTHRSAASSGMGGPSLPGHVNFYASAAGDHESPNRMRIKDKRSWQPSYLHKNKPPAPPSKDKRKLREKRRSSGLVHPHSAEVYYVFNVERNKCKIPNTYLTLLLGRIVVSLSVKILCTADPRSSFMGDLTQSAVAPEN